MNTRAKACRQICPAKTRKERIACRSKGPCRVWEQACRVWEQVVRGIDSMTRKATTEREKARPVRTLRVKLHNRRVIGTLLRDGSVQWGFKNLRADGLIDVTRIRLSAEALGAMNSIAFRLAKQPAKEQRT